MNKLKTITILTLGFLLLSSFVYYQASNSKPKQTPNINSTATTNSTYTLRSLLNSSNTSVMSVSESGGTATITTSTVTPGTTDKMYTILDLSLSFNASYEFSISSADEYWLIPFNSADNPLQISVGGGGGGGTTTSCFKHFCPCSDVPTCQDKCSPSSGVGSDGRYHSMCTQTVGDNMPCPSGCRSKVCKIACANQSVIQNTYDGPCYIIKADIVIFNGVTYN